MNCVKNQQDKVEANVFGEMTALGAKERKLYQILYSKFPVYTIPPTMFFGFAIGPGAQFDQNQDLQKIWITFAQVLESGKGGAILALLKVSPVSAHIVVFGPGNTVVLACGTSPFPSN
uniref:Uncharacterized protein n=1 Tax=Brassica campestris TaxID=3711 RepID=M4DZQ8_BRACM